MTRIEFLIPPGAAALIILIILFLVPTLSHALDTTTNKELTLSGVLLDPFDTQRNFNGYQRLPKPLEDQWLEKFRAQLSLTTIISTIPSRPELSAKLKEIQKQSLLMNDEETLAALANLDGILEKSPPDSGLAELYSERIAIEISAQLSSAAENSNIDSMIAKIPETSAGACLLNDFSSKLPTKFAATFKNYCDKRLWLAPSATDFSKSLLNGRNIGGGKKGPQIVAGKYLRHRIAGDFILTEKCDIRTENEMDCRETSRHDLYSVLPASNLKRQLLATKPESVLLDGLFVSIPKQETPLVIIASNRTVSPSSNHATIAAADSSIWQSPWLWAGIVVAAGLTGYGIYEVAREQTVTTP